MPDPVTTTTTTVVPPTAATVTPVVTVKTKERIPWQRIALSIVGIAIVLFVWRWATFHLYALPVTSISAFASITTNSLYVIAALVIFFVTGQVFYNWSNQSTTQIIQEAKQLFEKKDVTERTIPAKYFDDPEIP